jgi:hypothetical protein
VGDALPNSVPEPGSLTTFGIGLTVLCLFALRRRPLRLPSHARVPTKRIRRVARSYLGSRPHGRRCEPITSEITGNYRNTVGATASPLEPGSWVFFSSLTCLSNCQR